MGYGFAEYHTSRDALAAVSKEQALRNAKKCTIGSNNIYLSFPHMGVFPHASIVNRNYDKQYAFAMPNSEHRHMYHDERYYGNPATQQQPRSARRAGLRDRLSLGALWGDDDGDE